MNPLSLYENRQKRETVLRMICPESHFRELRNHVMMLRETNQDRETHVSFTHRSDGDTVVKISASVTMEDSSLVSAIANELFPFCVAETSVISFIRLVVPDTSMITEGAFGEYSVSYRRTNRDRLDLQIVGSSIESARRGFSDTVQILIKSVFLKKIDFDLREVEPEEVTYEFVQKMIRDFTLQKTLEPCFAFQIILQTKMLLQSQPSLVDVTVPNGNCITVCGDIHGQFYDLVNIFRLNGFPSKENPYLFNGDFVDRGAFSVEVILTLFAIKCYCPSAINLGRGNHESRSMTESHGFRNEVYLKMGGRFYELFAEAFCCLPLAHLINKSILVVHGGLFSSDGVTLSDIRRIDRFRKPPRRGLMCDLLWSDPQAADGRRPSKRGIGICFGADVTHQFLRDNNLDLLIRSHEAKEEGFEIHHDGKLITVFSAPNYCDDMGNEGAFIKLVAPDLIPRIRKFSAVLHPVGQQR